MPGDTNNNCDVFVYDVEGVSNVIVSVGSDGQLALGGDSAAPVISGNGRFVAFVSAATNLVSGMTTSVPHLYMRDLATRVTTLESVDSAGTSLGQGGVSGPVTSCDGRYLAFLFRTNPTTAQ